uniref:Ig-like domain-containing protein n=1 Tax=Labrus bergylta TaxID=56723 RepID=A0A3Q3N3K8_9LABR
MCFNSTGVSHSNDVNQTPPSIFKRINESVTGEIKCSHNITNYDRILWYKQDAHRALKLLGVLNVQHVNLEPDVKGKINFDGDGREKSSLSVSNLSLTDSGVYFCAASRHSAADLCAVSTRTPLSLSADSQHVQAHRHLQSTQRSEPPSLRFYQPLTQFVPRLRTSTDSR